MAQPSSGLSPFLASRVADWLMQMALENADLESIVEGCCERLLASGIPLARVHLSFAVLHPLYRAMGFTWRRGQSLEIEGYRHNREGETDKFLKSPYYHMFSVGLEHLRCRLELETSFDFPILEDLANQGVTDYLAFVSSFESQVDSQFSQGMIGSWSTDRNGGFANEEIAELVRIQNRLAVACKMAVQGSLASSMLTTYLGAGAGDRVMNGQIRRGDGETIRAAIIMADIRESTKLAESLGRQGYINTLNDFFDSVAGAFSDAGAEILSFMGDGFLAVIPSHRNHQASVTASNTAHQAALTAVHQMHQTNLDRIERGDPEIRFGIGLHIGNVMFGNVGLEDRLAFSVFGAAVNEAARLENLTKKYHTPIIVSQTFVDYCKNDWQDLGEETLRGAEHPMKVYAPRAALQPDGAAGKRRKARNEERSNAESVILLHRERPRKAG